MLLGVKVWEFGPVPVTGMLRDMVVFGVFLLRAVVLFIVLRRRDRHTGSLYPGGPLARMTGRSWCWA